MDGTLVDAGGAGRRALEKAFLRLHGIENGCNGVGLAGKTDLQNVADVYRKNLGRRPTRREILRIRNLYLRCLPGELPNQGYRVYPGVKKFLRDVSRSKENLLALGTGNIEEGARMKLEPAGLNRYFKFGGYGSDGHERYLLLKKAYRRARPYLNGDRLNPKMVFVIGDTHLDVLAGKKAGFTTIGLATGFDTPEELKKAKPHFLAGSWHDLRRWWAKDIHNKIPIPKNGRTVDLRLQGKRKSEAALPIQKRAGDS